MNLLAALACLVGSALAATLATHALIGRLQAAAVIDVPSARGLHRQPVPRGGGLAVAAVVLGVHALLLVLALLPPVAGTLTLALGACFAWLGWLDDRASRAVLPRLLAQCVLAIVAVASWLSLPTHGGSLALLAAGALALVWHVNLTNFMDGADGFVGTHALLTGLAFAALNIGTGHVGVALWALALAGASLGFLRWNWHPARIFLGDAGSYFIGFELAALTVASVASGIPAAAAAILLAPLVVDASLTLTVRTLQRAAPWRAHRAHAYQRLVLAGWSPAQVAGALATVELALCWPLAWSASVSSSALPALGAYALLAIIWACARSVHPGT